eukprot:g28252.t1
MVWRTDLYIAKARRQLSDASSYHPLDHDPTPDHQNIIFQTIHNLITSGGGHGNPHGPKLCLLFIGYVEQSLCHSYTGTIPHLFLRYIDDCFGAASCSHEELEQFINFTKTFHPNLKFTWTISDTTLSFLDLSVSLSGDHFETDIYLKPTDSHRYLDYTSSHPPSCKNANPYSQFLRLRRVCSQDGAFHSRTSQTSSYFKDPQLHPFS